MHGDSERKKYKNCTRLEIFCERRKQEIVLFIVMDSSWHQVTVDFLFVFREIEKKKHNVKYMYTLYIYFNKVALTTSRIHCTVISINVHIVHVLSYICKYKFWFI